MIHSQRFCIGQFLRNKTKTADKLLALTTRVTVVLRGITSEYYDN